MKKKSVLFLFCFFSAFFLLSCGQEKRKDNTIAYATHVILSTLNHHITDKASDIIPISNVMEGLLTFDSQGHIVCGTAQSYTISKDGLTYTFKIRPNAKWSNGDKVTAGDFEFAWKALAQNQEAPYRYQMISYLKNGTEVLEGKTDISYLGVKAINEETLIVNLQKPTPYFLSCLVFAAFFPLNQKVYEEFGSQYGTTDKRAVYNGAFIISGWKIDQIWTYLKNPYYWDKENVQTDEIIVSVISDPQSLRNAFIAGESDILSPETGNGKHTIEFLEKEPQKYKRIDFKEAVVEFIFLSPSIEPSARLLSNKRFRLALSHSINKKELMDEIIGNGSKAIDYFVPYDFTWLGNGNIDFRDFSGQFNDSLSFNPALAKKEFETALKELSAPFELTISIQNSESSKLEWEYIKDQIEKNLPALKITLRAAPANQLYDEMGQYMIGAGQMLWSPDFSDPTTFLDLFKSDNPLNYAKYNNPKYDALLNEASKLRNLNNPKTRFALLAQAEQILLEDAVIIPIQQRSKTIFTKPNISDIVFTNIGASVFFKFVKVENGQDKRGIYE